jgi:hypothetical protein
MIKINFEKAQAITKDRLREERKPLLEALDIQAMRSLGDPVKFAEVELEKQSLRDVTKKVDTVETLDELKALTV